MHGLYYIIVRTSGVKKYRDANAHRRLQRIVQHCAVVRVFCAGLLVYVVNLLGKYFDVDRRDLIGRCGRYGTNRTRLLLCFTRILINCCTGHFASGIRQLKTM